MKSAYARVSNRALWLLGLLIASLGLTAMLAWQAQRAASSHLAAAQNALREYGLLVADEFARRTVSTVGYDGYFRLVTFMRNAAVDSPGALRAGIDEAGDEIRKAAALAGAYYFFDPVTGLTQTTARRSSEGVQARLAVVAAAGAGDEPFGVETIAGQGGRTLLIYVRVPGGQLRAFTVHYAALQPWLAEVLDAGPLLPVALADGQVTNEVLYLAVADPNGETLFRSGERYDPYLRVTKVIGDGYQGIFEGFTVIASIDPAYASSLVIGGLPRSRLPVLLALIVLTIGLLVAAIWLYRREQAVMRLREDFVAQASHELRTPLTQIRMFAETLLLDRVRDDEERKRALRIINRESVRLVQLADNLLEFSSSGHRRSLNPVEQFIAPVIRQVCRGFEASGQATDIKLDLDESLRSALDADALRQVLVNLLDNAVKYGPPEQEIRVTLESRATMARLTVRDEGPGIPASESEAVWVPFHRLERERRNGTGGAGIGLAVVRELVEAHGGRCGFETGRGGCAFVELPLAVGGS